MPLSHFELTENFKGNEKHLNYIIKGGMSFNVFKACIDRACDIDEKENHIKDYTLKQKKQYYNYIVYYCENIVKNNYIVKTKYTHNPCGRYYTTGHMNLQILMNELRGFLCKSNMTDLDIKNSEPTIIRSICKKYNILCPYLDEYVKNRTKILEDNKLNKMMMIASMNFYKHNKKIDNVFFNEFDKEMKRIQKDFYKIDEYKNIIDTIDKGENNLLGMTMNRIYFYEETKIIMFLKSLVESKNIKICSYAFDGLMLDGNYYNNIELLTEINNIIRNEFKLDELFEFTYKAHNDEIKIDPEWKEEEEPETCEEAFKRIVPEFEKIHCKILNRNCYIKTVDETFLTMSNDCLKKSYQHMTCGVNDKGAKQSFIDKWMIKNDNILCYDDMQTYANSKHCPDNIFNLWTPFKILKTPSKNLYDNYDKYKDIPQNENIKFLLNHLKILCDNNENDFMYFLKWIAQMFQYPDKKTVAIYFISEEGAGKGTLLHLLKRLMGDNKIFSTSNPKQEIFGQFNPLMQNAFLVNFNEVDKKDLFNSKGKLKELITDPTITISKKGIDSFEINSFHRCLITTNPTPDGEEPITTSKGSRRDVIIRCSDQLTKKTEENINYFNKIYALLDDIEIMRDFYDFLMAIPNLNEFNKIPLPKTEYQQNITELSTPNHVQFLKYYTNEHFEDVLRVHEINSKELYQEFVVWCGENNIKVILSFPSFCTRLKNSKIDGIETIADKKCAKKRINVDLLINYFDLKIEEEVKEIKEKVEDIIYMDEVEVIKKIKIKKLKLKN